MMMKDAYWRSHLGGRGSTIRLYLLDAWVGCSRRSMDGWRRDLKMMGLSACMSGRIRGGFCHLDQAGPREASTNKEAWI